MKLETLFWSNRYTLFYFIRIYSYSDLYLFIADVTKLFDLRDLKNYRVDVIESNYLIKLRVGFLSENIFLDEDVDVILILAISLPGWPGSSDYPHRIPITNCDVLFHHQIATTVSIGTRWERNKRKAKERQKKIGFLELKPHSLIPNFARPTGVELEKILCSSPPYRPLDLKDFGYLCKFWFAKQETSRNSYLWTLVYIYIRNFRKRHETWSFFHL